MEDQRADPELLVSDVRGTFVDRASRDMTTTVSRPDPRSLRFTQVHEDEDGRYRLTETHVTDPARDAYVVRALVARDDQVSTALVARPALTRLRNGYAGRPINRHQPIGPGNVVQRAVVSGVTGRLGATWAKLVLGFGRKPARAVSMARQTRGTRRRRTSCTPARSWPHRSRRGCGATRSPN